MTTVLLNASLGSEQYQSVNSRMACSYDRRELGDVKLLRTAIFECSRSGNRSIVLGVRLRFEFRMSPILAKIQSHHCNTNWQQAGAFYGE